MKIILVIIVAICQAFITSIPIYNKALADRRHKFPQSLTKAGRLMVFFIALTIVATMMLFGISEHDQKKFQNALNDTLKSTELRQQAREDKLSKQYNKQVDSVYKKSNQTFEEVILKYGLHFDSMNNTLIKGVDSSNEKNKRLLEKMAKDSNRAVKYYSTNRPSLTIQRGILTKVTKDSLFVQLKLSCLNTTAYNVYLPIYYGYQTKTHLYAIGKNTDFAYHNQLSTDYIRTAYFQLPNNPECEVIFFYIKGSYTDIPGLNITMPFERVYQFNPKNKKFGESLIDPGDAEFTRITTSLMTAK